MKLKIPLKCLAAYAVMAGLWGWAGAASVGADTNPILQLSIGQPIRPDQEGRWSAAEGLVTFVGRQRGEVDLELSSEAGHMRVTVAEDGGDWSGLLLHSHIRVEGICAGVRSSDNGEIVSTLAVASRKQITLLQVPQDTWQQYPQQSLAALAAWMQTNSPGRVVRLRGQIQGTNADGTIRLADKSGTSEVRFKPGWSGPVGTQIELLGTAESQSSNSVIEAAVFQTVRQVKNGRSALPLLTTTEQVRWLSPAQAKRRYPVRVRVVVTFVLRWSGGVDGNFQDGSGGIYAWNLVPTSGGGAVEPGDYCEVEGDTSAGEFSPGIYCHRLKILGRGQFPEPARPGWDELVGGSFDAQWVEIEGIVLSTSDQHLEIGTQGGHISCYVSGGTNLERFLDAVVRVRGVVVADPDAARHVQGLHLNLPGEEFVSREMPSPKDPFALTARHVKELLYYDPGEPAFRREKITGEIVGVGDGVYYLMDDTNGLRLYPKDNLKLAAGDIVEAAGFPRIDDTADTPLISLREAVVRVTGQAPLPAAQRIAPADLSSSQRDATLVRTEAQLVQMNVYGANQVLELQAGARTFFARLKTAAGMISFLPPGSRVEVTGVYVFNNGRASGPAPIGPYELLLNAPSDVRVLELPSWWTSGHALMVVSGMSVVILLGLVWISLLRQQVGRRTVQLSTANRSLEAEIAERKRAENELVQARLEHLMEQERTRIARDIHDELGSSLSQIRLLSEMPVSQNDTLVETQSNAGKISAKALEATRVLDEIVWAVDPQNDTLEGLLNYLFSFASDYLSLAGVRFRIDAPTRIPHHVLVTQVRHQLYMAIKETLTNVINHAHATEVWIRVRLEAGAAVFIVEDNGRGFDLTPGAPGASGLENMRRRFKDIGGDFNLDSAPGRGTRVRFVLPLADAKAA